MKKVIKTLTIIGVVLFVIGIIFLCMGLCLGGYKSTQFEVNTYVANKEYKNIVAEINAVQCEIEYYDEAYIKIDYPISEKYTFSIDDNGDTIKISGLKTIKWYRGITSFGFFKKTPKVKIYLPSSQTFNLNLTLNAGTLDIDDGKYGNINLKLNAGKIVVRNILCNRIDIDVNAGSLLVASIETKDVTIDVRAGSLDIDKLDANKTNIDVSAGSVDVRFVGRKPDYTITAEKSAGSCNVSTSISQTATKYIDIEVSAGSVDVHFLG